MLRVCHRWSSEEEQTLIKTYPTSSIRQLLKLFPQRTRASIEEKAHLLKLMKNNVSQKVRQFSEFERGYLSGFVDGEGTLGLYRYERRLRNKRGFQWQIHFSVLNTDPSVIRKVEEIVGDGRIDYSPPKGNNKASWRYTANSNTLRALLPQLEFTAKHKHKQLILKALSLSRKGKHVTPEIDKKLEMIRLQLKKLNRRGRK